jgi:TrkA-N domain
LLSTLFIVLAARLSREELHSLDLSSVAFLAVLVFVIRPLAVLTATAGSALGPGERLFLAWMAPRGIVAAAVAPVFALNLAAAGDPAGARLVPVTYLVILGTGALYGLSAAPLALRLGLAQPHPQGVLFAGANSWARPLAAALQAQGCPVLLVDSLRENVAAARLEGLPSYHGSILAERTLEELDFRDLGRLVALTPREEVNALACLRFTEVFGRREVYQLPFASLGSKRAEAVAREQRGRLLFGPEMTFEHLVERFGSTPVVRATTLTDVFDFAAFQKQSDGPAALPLAVVRKAGAEVLFFTVGHALIRCRATWCSVDDLMPTRLRIVWSRRARQVILARFANIGQVMHGRLGEAFGRQPLTQVGLVPRLAAGFSARRLFGYGRRSLRRIGRRWDRRVGRILAEPRFQFAKFGSQLGEVLLQPSDPCITLATSLARGFHDGRSVPNRSNCSCASLGSVNGYPKSMPKKRTK